MTVRLFKNSIPNLLPLFKQTSDCTALTLSETGDLAFKEEKFQKKEERK